MCDYNLSACAISTGIHPVDSSTRTKIRPQPQSWGRTDFLQPFERPVGATVEWIIGVRPHVDDDSGPTFVDAIALLGGTPLDELADEGRRCEAGTACIVSRDRHLTAHVVAAIQAIA